MQKDYYGQYYILERSHWWFKARLVILEALLVRNGIPGAHKPQILNAGIATGATTTMLEKHGEVTSLEYDADCCEFVRDKLNIDVIQGSLTALPFEDSSFDWVCAFDVIEHIEDDTRAMTEIKRVLRPGGRVFFTVPAYQFLWSEHDDINHHFRRYTQKKFEALCSAAGFILKQSSYFNFFLFPFIAFVRLVGRIFYRKDKNNKSSDFQKFKGNNLVNKVLYQVFKSEKEILGSNTNLPFGVSFLYIGEKR